MQISPQNYRKFVGNNVSIHWVGPGSKTCEEGELLYAFTRKHPVCDDGGKIIGWEIVPFRCGIQFGEVSIHYTNSFEIHTL
jgi:hypothetical protein